MVTKYYHLYTIPKSKNEKPRRRNVTALKSKEDAREAKKWYNGHGIATGVYINQSETSPDELPIGEKLW